MSLHKTFLTILALLMLVVAPFAQNLPSELEQAREALNDGRAEAALRSAEAYLRADPGGEYAFAAHILAGRANVHLDRIDEALDHGYSVLDQAGKESPYRADARYLLATAWQARGDHGEAAKQLVRALDSDPSRETQEKALARLDELLDGPAAYKANELMLLARNEGTRLQLRKLLPVAAEQPVIGVVMPDEESGWEEADVFVEGIQAALAAWEANGGVPIVLEIRRVAPEGTRAVVAARELVREFGVWALIVAGPEELIVPAGVEAQAAGVPVLFPGQGRPSLEGIGPSVVQTVADWRLEGEMAASYATDVLGLRTFGIVAPFTDRGRETVAGFLDVLEQHDNVEVLDQEWYRPEEGVSLAVQFKRLRTVGFKREFLNELIEEEITRLDSIANSLDSLNLVTVDTTRDSLAVTILDSLEGEPILRRIPRDSVIISPSRLEKEWQQHLIEGRQTIEFKTGKVDSNAIALDIYDGLYLPIEPATLPFFAPQFAFYEFNTVRMGNSAWHDPDELLRQKEYVEHVIFTSPVDLQAVNIPMDVLRTRLGDSLNVAVEEWHVHGFDAARLILTALTGGGVNELDPDYEIVREGPLAIAMGLRHLKQASLASGEQTFADETPVAQGMWLLAVERGQPYPLEPGLVTPDRLEGATPPDWVPTFDEDTLDSLQTETEPDSVHISPATDDEDSPE